jgi:hypothetical protein
MNIVAKDFIFYEFSRMNMQLNALIFALNQNGSSLPERQQRVEFTWLAYMPALLGERILRIRDTDVIWDATFRVAHNNRSHVSDPVRDFERLTT